MMPKPAKALETASNKPMIGANLAAEFWAAVEDCLVSFHRFSRNDAAGKVTEVWRRLANLESATSSAETAQGIQNPFQDMIYHAEPWYLACNLANQEKDLSQYRIQYEQILKQNHLA
jgi:hypothetical protein